jgi:hypothetical protein
VGAHPLDRQVGLASVCGAKNGPNKAVTARGHAVNIGIDAAKRKPNCGQPKPVRLLDLNFFYP